LKKSGPAVSEIASADALTEFTKDRVAVVFFGDVSSDAYATFASVAD